MEEALTLAIMKEFSEYINRHTISDWTKELKKDYLQKLEGKIYNNLHKVQYEERSDYGVIDAISDAFEEEK